MTRLLCKSSHHLGRGHITATATQCTYASIGPLKGVTPTACCCSQLSADHVRSCSSALSTATPALSNGGVANDR